MQTLQHLITSLNIAAVIVGSLAAVQPGGKENWRWIIMAGINAFCVAIAVL